ncbi:enhancer of split mbeta protein-like [Anthonomus grandis grandis]|uniref:enhancer of split mbeta protein-like n=1 Tax=Anthonomus grandis grandis TaxID=2921223 RepID=UPI0021652B59|nr:enhancer of split mbeta protein-like [Anthonomus grandis grandis]
MAPTPYIVSSSECGEEPISRTYQYRKVMKPMLERKRRARINRCLDELKELMVTALQSEGENVSKLEKADILELTVRHLHNLKRQHQLILPQEQSYADRFRAGFTQCAQEVSHFITAPPQEVVDPMASRKLLQHLSACVRQLDSVAQQVQMQQEQRVPNNYQRQSLTPPVSPECHVVEHVEEKGMWRPW